MNQVDKYRLIIVGAILFILFPITIFGLICSKAHIVILSILIIISIFIIDVKYLVKLEEKQEKLINFK